MKTSILLHVDIMKIRSHCKLVMV